MRGTPRTDPDERIYAIGDIHGCHDQLLELLDRIGDDNAARDGGLTPNIVFLGDMIDRGAKSADVIAHVFELVRDNSNIFALLGNHEQALCNIASGSTDEIRDWLRMGGRSTLRSYGIDPDWAKDNHDELAGELTKSLPSEQLRWLRKLPLSARSGDYFFCHAGIKPGVNLARQQRDDLLWIRDEFLSSTLDHGAVIVHGHSVVNEVQVERNRISVDTGAYRTGRLSAVMLEHDQRKIITTNVVSAA